jgi:hypothetical protein
MPSTKRVITYALIGSGASVLAQAAYVASLFNEALARVVLVPAHYAAFWPTLLYDLVRSGNTPGPEAHPLWVGCLGSVGGWALLGAALAAIVGMVRRRAPGRGTA